MKLPNYKIQIYRLITENKNPVICSLQFQQDDCYLIGFCLLVVFQVCDQGVITVKPHREF